MQIKALAKFNLNLHLYSKKDKNGLYPVSFLNCNLALADKIDIKIANTHEFSTNNTNSFIKIKCLGKPICYSKNCPNQCLIFKAVKLLQKQFPNKATGLVIKIKKNIPVKAGLGGGSSDAGAVLKYLNQIWHLNLPNKKLVQLANQIGKDVCYSVIGGLCKISGAGEIVKPLNLKMPKIPILIVIPKTTKPSTAWCYQNLNPKSIGKNLSQFNKLVKSLKKSQITNNKSQITNYLHNDFETLIFTKFLKLKLIKQQLLKLNAQQVILAGSGLSLVAFFNTLKQAKIARNKFKNYQTIISFTR